MLNIALAILILLGAANARRIARVNQLKDTGAVFSAVYQGDVETVRRYLDQGGSADACLPLPELKTKHGDLVLHSGGISLLHAAVGNNQLDIVELLLERGANPNCYAMGSTPLVFNRVEMDPLLVPNGFAWPGAPTNEEECATALQTRLEIGRQLIAHGGAADRSPYLRREWAKGFLRCIANPPTPALFMLYHRDRVEFHRDGLIHPVPIPADIGEYRVRQAFESSLAEWLNLQKTNGTFHLVMLAATDATNRLWGLRAWCKSNDLPVADERIPTYVHGAPDVVVRLFTNPRHPLDPNAETWKDFCPGAPDDWSEDQTEWRRFFLSDATTLRAQADATQKTPPPRQPSGERDIGDSPTAPP